LVLPVELYWRQMDLKYIDKTETGKREALAALQKETIAVAIAGVNGRMGRASAQVIAKNESLSLVGAFGRQGADYSGKSLDQLVGLPFENKTGILVSSSLAECLSSCSPDVLLDFTEANGASSTAIFALEKNVRPVIGTSGLSLDQLKRIDDACRKHKLGALVVPNFSVGAILMINFAKQAAKLFDHIEITEMHHTGKLDAPSGTAMHTAKEIAETDRLFNQSSANERELISRVRGAKMESGLRLHSLRLPGLLSRQEVLFGAEGELLTIRHESFNSKCFEAGIVMAIKEVMQLRSLVIGLDSFVLAKL